MFKNRGLYLFINFNKHTLYLYVSSVSIHLKFVEDKMSSRRDETELWDTDFLKVRCAQQLFIDVYLCALV